MKRALATTFQVCLTVAIVWWVFREPAKRAEIAQTFARAEFSWLLGGLLGYGLVELISAFRWQMLLRVQEIRLSFRRVFALTMIGVFFNFFIPGGTGGDAVKMFYLVKETPGQKARALLSVVVDRLIGLFALIIFAGAFIALKWNWLFSAPQTAYWIWVALAVLGGGMAFIAVSFIVTRFGLVHHLPVRMPGRDKLAELALAYGMYGRAWRAALAAFALSLVAHAGFFGVFYCALRALASSGVEIPTLVQFMAIMPIIGTITSLPISLGGVGWREMLFETFFGALCAAPAGVAVAISSAGFLLLLAWGLVGALIYTCYRPSEHARLREMRAQVQAMEHALAEEEVALESKGPAK